MLKRYHNLLFVHLTSLNKNKARVTRKNSLPAFLEDTTCTIEFTSVHTTDILSNSNLLFTVTLWFETSVIYT